MAGRTKTGSFPDQGIKAQEEVIAWDPTEHGNFRKDYFKPIIIPTVPHTP